MTAGGLKVGGGLAGMGVVVTRPAGQAGRLASLIEQAGGHAILFPAIEILPVADPLKQRRLADLLARLDEFELAVFISPTAVRQAMPMIGSLPDRLQFAAIGAATARELHGFGIANVLAPQTTGDSEALLALPDLQAVAEKRVVIFRGEGGRDLLADTLAQRGARIEFAECYRRVKPPADPAPLFAAWREGRLHAITATSGEGLRNLLEMLGQDGRRWLSATRIFVPHPRVAETARELRLERITLTDPGDDGLLRALLSWATTARGADSGALSRL